MTRRLMFLALVAGFVLAATASFAAGPSPVKVWETKIVIPTYLAGDPEPNPMFFFGRESQGSQGPVYPYPMYDKLTGHKVDKTYTIVYLENEYIRIGVLPEIGGRIFEGIDKTNGYNFIYRQHVIKPALIGLLGAWISGGVEWNIPFHHRATTFLPVQYKLEENADGSKTIWVGELEPRQRMRWAVGYTLYPGSARLEAKVRILNRTPEVNTMLLFANLAISANNDYQVIFPPSTQYGVFHAKREFTEWPVSHQMYAGSDFTAGVDVSWYKNHPTASSIFAWNYQDDFFAGYDHGKQAGVMSVADHNIAPGKKFWTWGNGPSGKRWDSTLSDDDGPYMELMTGAYSDNQPDYSWMQPYESRSFSINWYPFRDIGGVKQANLDAAVNLEVTGTQAQVGFYTTSAHAAAHALLKAGDKVLLDRTVAINPAKPFTTQVDLPAGTDEHDLVASLTDGGRELVSYSPIRLSPQPMPPVVTPPPAPQDVKTNDELYLIGLRAQQFHDPVIDPLSYWKEALRRDPGDTRVNTALGISEFTAGRYTTAEAYLRKALERATDRYTDPKDAEPLYYLGATLQAEGKTDEAYTDFYKATWSAAWKSAGYFGLAQIAISRSDMNATLDFANHSLDSNALDIRAINLKAAALRHTGHQQQALALLAGAAHRADPLDARSMAEEFLASRDKAAAQRLATTLNTHPQDAQETAAEYMAEGLWQDGADVLTASTAAAPDQARIHPMDYYYLGYFESKLGHTQKAAQDLQLAASMPTDYVFPFEHEEAVVLRAAIAANPHDARAPYYLGNELYDTQPEEAVRMWQASVAIDPGFAIVHRNLATAYMHQATGANLSAAIAELEKAVSLDHKYALHFTELDELYEQAGTPLEKRLQLFEQNQAVVDQRDDAINRELALQIATGNIDSAIRTMTTHTFAVAEGANLNVAEHWTDAHILRAQSEIAAKRYPDALADLKAAAVVPENLPIPVGYGSAGGNARYAEIDYWTGVACQRSGDAQKAAEFFHLAVAPRPVSTARAASMAGNTADDHASQVYFQALAYRQLGQDDQAKQLFQSLIDSGQRVLKQPLSASSPTPRARNAAAHYLQGLGLLGLNDTVSARDQFQRAVASSPDLLGARVALASLPQ